ALDLGMAPLAGLEDRRLAPVFARVGALVFEEGGALYGFQGLRSYKAKFFPDWKPRFIAAPISTPLPVALLDVALLSSGGWPGLLGLRRGRR
ncbi:phosphatidylglycerol lysyltransferase domain-containing protein, partial [uncultured Brevundimonas sp.]|uniref:phosphatidylglycerol lysyltransferase domain-containing protein n=1 Tax=uncultured Brevundimonas sp. TaxID=213418 RepID=UPI0025D3DB64